MGITTMRASLFSRPKSYCPIQPDRRVPPPCHYPNNSSHSLDRQAYLQKSFFNHRILNPKLRTKVVTLKTHMIISAHQMSMCWDDLPQSQPLPLENKVQHLSRTVARMHPC